MDDRDQALLIMPVQEKIIIRGRVQGVGMRPHLHRQASALELSGQARNTCDGVELLLQGRQEDIDAFVDELRARPPAQALIRDIERTVHSGPPFTGFDILPSLGGSATTALPPDRASCADCVKELFEPGNRRYQHPFISCTQCGPRHSIVQTLPWDRSRTSMAPFSQCPRCQAETRDPADRRFHSQTNSCHDCGPRLQLLDTTRGAARAGAAAMDQAGKVLSGGGVLALKGLAGYQLLARADCPGAISRLRQFKQRQRKPLALMCGDLDAIADYCEFEHAEAQLLTSPLAPIVLLPRRTDSAAIDTAVAPGLDRLGVMLPATPLQHLLLAPLDTAVVATSANRRGEALIYQDTDAVELLAAVADAILMYDREILHPLDDSIVQVVLERTMVLRRARGFDLYCGDLPQSSNTALAYGADLKNCIAVNRGTEILSAPHVGNLDSVSAEKLLASRAEALCEIYQLTPAQALCDRHPDYVSHRLAHDSGLPVHEIQHHRAHAWATLLENPAAGRPLLAAVWDGTGYGEDGTVWGGEFFLLAQRGETRIASLYPLRLPGAEQAIREPARVAFSLLYTLFGAGALDHPALPASSTLDYALLARLLEQGVNTPQCSSVGRLFDGVAALLGLSPAVDYEAEAAIGLEQLASRYRNRQDLVPYPTALLDQETPWRLDWRPMLLELLADWHDPASTADYIAARFHLSMAHAILHVVKATGCEEVLVGGGCFQNRVLMDMLYRLARQQQVTLHWPRTLPPGDGAIAAGQLTAQLMRQGDD